MKTITRQIAFLYALAGLLATWTGPAGAAPDPAVRPYSAVYEIEYKGRNVGTMEVSVRYDATSERYRF